MPEIERPTRGCAKCGACCDPVFLTPDNLKRIKFWSDRSVAGMPDPSTAEGWAQWLKQRWTDADRPFIIRNFRPGSEQQADADFAAEHWHKRDDGTDSNYTCDMFDPESRECTAHEARPPVCRNYPWYGHIPGRDRAAGMHPECSYLGDVPPADRPEGAWPLIPIEVVRR
jgi:Fe-S-cluster containining protein